MNFDDYQFEAAKTAIFMDGVCQAHPDTSDEIMDFIALSYTALGLGEVGEIQGKIKKILRDNACKITDEHVNSIAKELGDVLWYVAAMCDTLGIYMDNVAQSNIDKLSSRKERGKLSGSGDDR